MTLYDYIKQTEEGTEVTIWDKNDEYDIESYFYNDEPDGDSWQTSMLKLAKLLEAKELRENKVEVNLSEVIEKNLDKLKEADLFIRCTTNSIMDDMQNILSGYVSEEWFKNFVDVLGVSNYDTKEKIY